MAKTAANLAAKFVCDEAIQLLGGYGFSREYPVERVYRDIRGLVHRRGHRRDPAQLRRHQRVARRDAGQRRLEAPPRLSVLAATFAPARAAEYRRAGGAVGPPVARRAAHRRRARPRCEPRSRASRAGCARPASVRATWSRGSRPTAGSGPRLPRVLAPRRDRGAGAPPGRGRRSRTRAGGRPTERRARISTRSRPARPVDRVLDRTGTTRRGAVHVGIERRAEGRAAHAGDARVQGRADGHRPTDSARTTAS